MTRRGIARPDPQDPPTFLPRLSMQIDYTEEPQLPADDFLGLAQRLWPGEYAPEAMQAALGRTINLTARVKGDLIGCVRILTDGYLFGTIPEILVSPEYQGQGVGRALMERAWERSPTGLFFGAQPGNEPFFEKLGYERSMAAYSRGKPRPGPERDRGGGDGSPPQEPWDYARFVDTYNALAMARGGWYYEPDGRTEDEMRERYHRGPRHFPDIRTFAEGLFIWDQRLNL